MIPRDSLGRSRLTIFYRHGLFTSRPKRGGNRSFSYQGSGLRHNLLWIGKSKEFKKNKSVVSIAQVNAFVVPFWNTEVFLKGWQFSHVHVRTADFVFR